MGMKTNKCCCGASVPPSLFVGISQSRSIILIRQYDMLGNVLTPTFWTLNTGIVASQPIDIACHPSGRVHIVTGDSKKLYTLDETGSVLWSKTDADTLLAVAVDSNMNVYTGGFNATVNKYDASGNHITSGGWPYVPAGPPYLSIRGISVDQLGNVYVCGLRVGGAAGSNLIKLSPAGTLLWQVYLGDGADSPANAGSACGDLSINAANTHLVVAKRGSATQTTAFIVNASTGSFTSARKNDNLAAEYNENGDYYTAGTNTANLKFNGSLVLSTGSSGMQEIVCDNVTDDAYVTQVRPSSTPRYNLFSCDSSGSYRWGVDLGATLTAQALEYSQGRLGAFGL